MNDSLLWYTTRGSGAVATLLLTAVVVLGIMAAVRFEAPRWPRFLTPALHRNLSLLSLVFLAMHIATAVADPYAHLTWLATAIPFSTVYRPLWMGAGTIATELMAAIVVTSLARFLIGVRAWRAVHWLAYAVWPLAIAHGLGSGTDAASDWMIGLHAACVAAVLIALADRLWVGARDPLAGATSGFRAAATREVPR
jgi:sulfoxide reductase heme-binding subunit YedZ